MIIKYKNASDGHPMMKFIEFLKFSTLNKNELKTFDLLWIIIYMSNMVPVG